MAKPAVFHQILGRPRTFANGEALLKKYAEYREYRNSDVFIHQHQVATKTGIQTLRDPQAKPYTLVSFMHFAGCPRSLWYEWRRDRPDLHAAMDIIQDDIDGNKYDGAAAGVFNAAIMTRDLGLIERVHNSHEGPKLPAPAIDPLDIPNLVHPLAPPEDAFSETPLLFSQRQLDAGVPYPHKGLTIDHEE